MANTHLHVRIDDETKKQAQQILSDMGLDLSTAVNMFIKQVVRTRGFPFLPTADLPCSEGSMVHSTIAKADADVERNVAAHDSIIDETKTASSKRPRSELFGILKGKVWMADDFDAPLEDMLEYMETYKSMMYRGHGETEDDA